VLVKYQEDVTRLQGGEAERILQELSAAPEGSG